MTGIPVSFRCQRRSARRFGEGRCSWLCSDEPGRQMAWANGWRSRARPCPLTDLFRIACGWLRTAPRRKTCAGDVRAALQSFHRFEKGTNCRAWLISILYHMNGKRRRTGAKLRLVSDTEERIAETVAFTPPTPQHIGDEEVLSALRSLPPQYQEVVVLSDVEDMSYKEISDALKIPVGTVMSRLHRGRKLLRSALASYASERGVGQAGADPGRISAPFSK